MNGLFLIDDMKDADTDEFTKQTKTQKINQTMITSLTEAIKNKEYTRGYVKEILGKYGYKELKDIEVENLTNIKKDLEI